MNPFSRTGKLVKRLSDPVLDPIERWILRRGGNPQNAEWWLLGGAVVGGIVIISLAGWLGSQIVTIGRVGGTGPRGVIRLVIYYGGQIVTLSLVVRVIGSWFGVGRYNRFMRPFYVLTDWVVEPLRRIIPPIGMIDITPIVAFFLVQILTGLILGFI